MTIEETKIEFDKVISMMPEKHTEGLFLYVNSNSQFKEKEYRGFKVKQLNVVPKKTFHASASKYHK